MNSTIESTKPRAAAFLGALLCAAACVSQTQAQEIFIPAGSAAWAYRDQGGLLDPSWYTTDYDASAWSKGTAPMGYGDGDEATVVGFGPDGSKKHITTYFRQAFEVADPTSYRGLQIRLLRDDGAVVYLNGAEIIRDNLPAGVITPETPALQAVGGADEDAYFHYTIDAEVLEAGHNLVAVEVHQVSPTSSDISFDLELVGELTPLVIEPVFPWDLATVDAASTPLTVAVTDPSGQASTVQVNFYGRPAGPAPGPDFCIVALPDTQYYTATKNGGTPEMFLKQIEWIRAQQASRNIVFVTQLGDCVENGDNGGDDMEWRQATNALYRLETHISTVLDAGIPYGFAPGNHDISGVDTSAPASVFFNQYFGSDHFSGRDYYGGHHGENNNNNYQLFSAGGMDFIVVHLEYDTTPEPALLAWADALLKAHATRRAIVVSHYLIEAGNQASFGAQGQAIYDALKNNPNLFLMLSGHVPGEGCRRDTWDGHTVHTLMSDYQGRVNGGNGWLRLLEFSPSNNVIRVRTYSPVLDQYETDADSEFTLQYDMRRGEPFREVGRMTGAKPNDHATLVWTNLQPGAVYEWYAQSTDGSRTCTSAVQCFSTGESPVDSEPGNFDSDGDGMSDAHEQLAGTDGHDAGSTLKIETMRVVDGRVVLSWASVEGRRYRVCAKPDLNEAAWADWSEDITAEGPITSWSEPIDPQTGLRFYVIRVVTAAP